MIGRPRKEPKELHTSVIRCCAQLNTRLKKLAHWLQHRANRFSLKTQKYLLLSFCALCLIGNVGIMVQGLQSPMPLRPAPIQVLRLQPSEQKVTNDPYQALLRLYHFRYFLDSLARTTGSEQRADSFFKARPQLLDTFHHLDNLFAKP